MTATETIEQKLAEFNRVHGTVLLGMHKRLESIDSDVRAVLNESKVSAEANLEKLEQALKEVQSRSATCLDSASASTAALSEVQNLLAEHKQCITERLPAIETVLAETHSRLHSLHGSMQQFADRTKAFAHETMQRHRDMDARIQTLDAAWNVGRTALADDISTLRTATTEAKTSHAALRQLAVAAIVIGAISLATSILVLVRAWIS
jgi:DNA repair exonuclease SbcCD ATPase subunit